MKKIKNILMAGAVVLAACISVPHASANPSNPTNLTAALPLTIATNATGAISNAPVTVICPTHGFPPNSGAASPQSVAIWASGAGLTAGLGTNTFVFANSLDGVTLVTTNTWSITLVANGTNQSSGWVYVPSTNFYGAAGFGLANMTGGTNGWNGTNGYLKVTWPQ